jgi:hypothetical protein
MNLKLHFSPPPLLENSWYAIKLSELHKNIEHWFHFHVIDSCFAQYHKFICLDKKVDLVA